MQINELVGAAEKAREKAYCPYSKFSVGAALLSADGRIFTGCNVENVTQGPGSCAERVALYKAVSEGVTAFTAIAVVGGKQGTIPAQFCRPCGVCRQALSEFCTPDFLIISACRSGVETHKLGEFLPFAFEL